MDKKFWKAACIRAIKTAAQTTVGTVATTATVLQDVNWAVVLSTAALSAVLSMLTSIAGGLPEVDE